MHETFIYEPLDVTTVPVPLGHLAYMIVLRDTLEPAGRIPDHE